MSDLRPAIDITSLNGVESIFRRATRDPWGRQLAGRLADLFVYSDVARFTMPVSVPTSSVDDQDLPPILVQLRSRDSALLVPVIYEIEQRRSLSAEHIGEAFSSFAAWAQNSRRPFKDWLRLHAEPWIREGHLARVRPRFVFDVDLVREDPVLNRLAAFVGASHDDILYGFDVVLRYPWYGELLGEHSYFLAHPIRELQRIPTLTVETAPAPRVALSLAPAVAEMTKGMTLDQYTSFLHEARGILRDRGVHKLKPGALDHEAAREIAADLGLPARLNAAGKVLGIAASIIGAAGASAALGPIAAVAGGVVSVASTLWTGTVGRLPSRIKWLRWALSWDIEAQARDA